MDTIETIILKNVEVQANGIIRNSKGRLIARLCDDVEFEGEHIKGLKEINKTGGTMKDRRKTKLRDWLYEISLFLIKRNKAYKGIDRRKS